MSIRHCICMPSFQKKDNVALVSMFKRERGRGRRLPRPEPITAAVAVNLERVNSNTVENPLLYGVHLECSRV